MTCGPQQVARDRQHVGVVFDDQDFETEWLALAHRLHIGRIGHPRSVISMSIM